MNNEQQTPLKSRLKYPYHLHMRFSKDFKERLEEYTDRTKRQKGNVLRDALDRYLKNVKGIHWKYKEEKLDDYSYEYILRTTRLQRDMLHTYAKIHKQHPTEVVRAAGEVFLKGEII